MGAAALLPDIQWPYPYLDTIKRPARVDGVERLMPQGRDDVWQFKVRDGVDRVRFGNPGYRLGYAKDAANSYFVFKTLREKGVLPKDMRFQISMPMVNSVIRSLTFPVAGDLQKIRPGYEEAIAAELDAIFDSIPHEDLAIQWDMAWEIAAVYDGLPGDPNESRIETHVAPVPSAVEEVSRKGRARVSFLFRHVRRLAPASHRKASAAQSNSRTLSSVVAAGRQRRLGSHPDARQHGRRLLCAAC